MIYGREHPAGFVVREDVGDEFAARKLRFDFHHIRMVASISQIFREVAHHHFFVMVRHGPFIEVIDKIVDDFFGQRAPLPLL